MTMKFKATKGKPKGNTFGQLDEGAVFRVSHDGDLYMKVDSNNFTSGHDLPANTLCFANHTLSYTGDNAEVFPTTLIVEEE